MRYPEIDLDRKEGCIRNKENAYSQDGGLAVLFGNIAERGCIVKTAGVDDSNLSLPAAPVCSRGVRKLRSKASSPLIVMRRHP